MVGSSSSYWKQPLSTDWFSTAEITGGQEMLRIMVAIVPLILTSAIVNAQGNSLVLDCSRQEAAAMQQAPMGARRSSRSILRVNWSNGSREFADSKNHDGNLLGTGFRYCGYNAVTQFHLIGKVEDEVFSGFLLDERNGRMLPAGMFVAFSLDRSSYFASTQSNGMDGEEWYVYTTDGHRDWMGSSNIVSMDPLVGVEMITGSLSSPHWSESGELQAMQQCFTGDRAKTLVTLKKSGSRYAWVPDIACQADR